mgnify:CR=1 FL=1
MKKRKLGIHGLEVSEIGLGCMTLGKDYSSESKKYGIEMMRRAYDLGVTMFDTAVVYGNGSNEILVGEALHDIRDKVCIATKCGICFKNGEMIKDGSEKAIRESLEASLKRLNTDYVDLLYMHRVGTTTPIEETAEAMAKLYKEGKILSWGISEPTMELLRRAHEVFPLAAIENEYSMMWRYPEEEVLPILEELSIGLVPYRPLAEGFLTNGTDGMYAGGAGVKGTRFSEESIKTNMALRECLHDLASQKGATAAQVALAWLLHQKPFIVPIPGTSKMTRMEENIGAANITFTSDELSTIRGLLDKIKIVGARYKPGTASANSVPKIQ